MTVDPDFNFLGSFTPVPHGTTGTLVGFPALTVQGTATARTTYSNSSMPLHFPRIGYVSAATAGSFASVRTTIQCLPEPALWAVKIRFAVTDPAAVSGARMFAGITAVTTALTNVEPSTMVNCFGIGHGASDSNWMIYCSGSAAGTPIDTGLPLSSGYMIDLTLAKTNYFGLIYRVDADGGGGVFSKSGIPPTGFAPAANSASNPINIMRTNNATALAVSLDILKMTIGTGD